MTDTAITPAAAAIVVVGGLVAQNPAPGSLAIYQSGESRRATWANLLNGFAGYQVGKFPCNSAMFQATGTFGSGGSVQMEGSNDALSWNKLSPTPLTASGFMFLAPGERPLYVRPHVTAGDSTTNIQVVGFFI